MNKRVDLPEKKYEGYIFDLDGTLVDSMPLHYKAWRKALARAGAPESVFREDEFYSCGGKSANDVVYFLNERYGLVLECGIHRGGQAAAFIWKCWSGRHAAHRGSAGIRALPGGCPQGYCHGQRHSRRAPHLAAAGLTGLFDVILTPEDVEHGKPAPDMFLLAAERLGAAPSRCVVFGRRRSGALPRAAAAGMDCVRVRRTSLS